MNQKITDMMDKVNDACCELSCAVSDGSLTDAHRQAVTLSTAAGKIRTMLWEEVNKKKDREESWP